VEVKEGVKISVTLGHLIIIWNIVKLAHFILTFYAIIKIKMLIFFEYALKSIKYLLVIRFLLSFPQLLSIELQFYTEKNNACEICS
jgi:hypothetical protein